jgi:hypothetical protein
MSVRDEGIIGSVVDILGKMCAAFPFRHLYGAARWKIVAPFSFKSGFRTGPA